VRQEEIVKVIRRREIEVERTDRGEIEAML
jgi:hypothetical protein